MNKYMIRYTENKGITYKTILINAKSYTEAYVNASCKIPKDAEITDLFEVIG